MRRWLRLGMEGGASATSVPLWRSTGFRLSALLAAIILTVEVVNLVTVSRLVLDVQRDALRSRSQGLLSAAQGLIQTPLELDVIDAGEQVAEVLFADGALNRLEVRTPNGIWLERERARPGSSVASQAELSGLDGQPLGTIRIWLDTSQFEAVQRDAIRQATLQTLLMLSTILVFVFLLVGSYLKPLKTLTNAARAIARGEVTAPETYSRRDEIAMAGQAFQHMQARLRALAESARRVERGDLEPMPLGSGPLFERFDKMVAALRSARERESEQRASLAEALKLAEAASEAKGRFLARVSHELRTPLNGVIGMTDLYLAESEADDPRRADLEVVRSSAGRMLHLVQEVLDFARVDAGELELEIRPVKVHELVQSEFVRHRLRAEMKGLALQVEVDPDLGRGRTDPRAVQQVLGCLIDNALKFTLEGRVVVRARAQDAWLRLEVEDTGPGIPEELQAAVFDAFEQADGSTQRTHQGVGVGLALARAVVDKLGGKLLLWSEVGVGSKFSLHVPFEPCPQDSAQSGPEVSEAPPRKVRRVLIAEDERVNQIILRRHLKAMGVEDVVLAQNGREAVEACRNQRFDLILMDCMMPELDGYEATRTIRGLGAPTAETPVVAVTANAMPGDREKCLASGMNDHLAKPIERFVLEAAFARWVEADS